MFSPRFSKPQLRFIVRLVPTVIKEGLQPDKHFRLEFGHVPVKLPVRLEPLNLIVVHGFEEEQMLLLTNEALTPSRKRLWANICGYVCRWLVEETIRFIKLSYRLEDMCGLSYDRLRNLMTLVLTVVYFAAV